MKVPSSRLTLRPLSASVSVSPQLRTGDLQELKLRGFRCIVNNRPDNEESGQPGSDELQQEARRLGLDYHAIPVVGDNVADADIDAFRSVLESMAVPLLAFCRSGTRSARLWALSCAATTPPDELLAAARNAGYDLAAMRPELEERWKHCGKQLK